MTRFKMWMDPLKPAKYLSKFCRLGEILNVFGNLQNLYLALGKILNSLWQICNVCLFEKDWK